ncbi:F-box/LRR-repeat protein 7-like isoform X2 [Dreissena polymorpha]|uniref:F-box/LRR-repeat protein 7-like isoform X2 n=1 Tax=Dreissena polymorpha TaxID=45954 RepID=UPI002264FEF8|nr:F-box/LRR-repeat protein 7-like isoform X2 [Dreissena polymorpha]
MYLQQEYLYDPLIAEHSHDSSSGIASDVTSSHNQSATRMSTFKGDNSSMSSADQRFSDSSFDRQFSDSSVSVERPAYIKKRQGDGKFPWAYTHGAKVAQQNRNNRDRAPMSSDSSSVGSDYPPTHVIPTGAPPSYEYHIQLQKQKQFIHSNSDLQDTDKLMLTSGKCKSKVRPSPFDLMTDDVIVRVFSNLPTDQLCRCSCVCKRWYQLAWDPLLWKKIVINNSKVHIDRALKYLTKRLSYNTPTVCVIVERINLNGCEKLTDKGVHAIAKSCPELRHLEIQGCANVTNTALFEVASYCVNLEYLDVTGCPCVTCIRLTDKLLAAATAPHLRQIYFRYLDMSECSALDDAGLVTISSYCTQLQYLFLRKCARIGDQGVQAVCDNCPNIRELSVSDCKRLTDYGASEISKLGDNLRYLSVAKCEKVSDVAIIQIARGCRKLRYLNARGCEAVSDDSLDTIARNLTRLKSLDIGKCDVTDEGLVALAYCGQLRRLSVKSCDAITDLGIITIAQHCTKLQQLNIQDCHVTLEAYRTVKKHCKRCLIEHTNPGFC